MDLDGCGDDLAGYQLSPGLGRRLPIPAGSPYPLRASFVRPSCSSWLRGEPAPPRRVGTRHQPPHARPRAPELSPSTCRQPLRGPGHARALARDGWAVVVGAHTAARSRRSRTRSAANGYSSRRRRVGATALLEPRRIGIGSSGTSALEQRQSYGRNCSLQVYHNHHHQQQGQGNRSNSGGEECSLLQSPPCLAYPGSLDQRAPNRRVENYEYNEQNTIHNCACRMQCDAFLDLCLDNRRNGDTA
jgi:hypothetical protein